MKHRVFVAVMFVIGCATGGVASQLVVPPARAGTNPPRWEYLCQEGSARLSAELNKAGAEGWELSTVFVTHQGRDRRVDGDQRVDAGELPSSPQADMARTSARPRTA